MSMIAPKSDFGTAQGLLHNISFLKAGGVTQAQHCGSKMEAMLVRNSMEKGGIFWHGPWICKKGGIFGSQPPRICKFSMFC